MTAGSSLRTVCKYVNEGDRRVIQGQDKEGNEMCMFVGYYYPAIPRPAPGFGAADVFENCVPTSYVGPGGGGIGDSYGTGENSCADTMSCVRNCKAEDSPKALPGRIEVGECFQKCIVESCPAASTPFNGFSRCLQTNCASECAGGGDCSSCVIGKCASEFGVCQSASCR